MKVKNRVNNSFIHNIMNVLSANFIVAFVGLINSLIFPRILSISDYAYYHTFTLYIGYLGILHLGFPTGMSIKYAGKNYNSIDKKLYKSELIILYSILAFFTSIFGMIYGLTHHRMVLYVTLGILPTCILGSYKVLLQAWNRFREYRTISIIITLCVPSISLLIYAISGKLTGDMYISIYLLLNWIITLYVSVENYNEVKNTKLVSMYVKENFQTEKIGFAILIGSYINVLLTSTDKQFVRCFFQDAEFAYYSFGMSMQSLMTVFIGSIAQPLFPRMASPNFKDDSINEVKDILLIFGSFSGIAFFGASFIVNCFLPHYKESLNVVSIYFVVFPVFAVVSCLYINLYKIKGLTKKYISTLVFVLVLDIIMNALLILIFKKYVMVAVATTLVYFIWFLMGLKQFDNLKLSCKNIIYLIFYMLGFFIITQLENCVIGCVIYFIYILVLIRIIYRSYFQIFIEYILKIVKRNKKNDKMGI